NVEVYLQTSASSFSLMGTAPLTVTDTRPAPGIDAITPNPVDLAAPPASFTVTGHGFANLGFGLPVANFIRNGAIVAQSRGTAFTPTSLTVPFPTTATPGLSVCAVDVQVYLQTSTSSFSLMGSAPLT